MSASSESTKDAGSSAPACSIPDDVRLWIAKVRDRLEHIYRAPITQTDGHALLRESIDIAQRYNCYESNDALHVQPGREAGGL